MKQKTRYMVPAALMLALVSGLLVPHTAHADGDRGKTVVIGPIVVTPDPAPSPHPKKR